MKHAGTDGGFWLCFALNLILSIGWLFPALVLLVLHFVLHISLLWALAAFVLWLVVVFAITLLLSTAARIPGTSQPKMTPEEQAAHDEHIREVSRSVGNRQPRVH